MEDLWAQDVRILEHIVEKVEAAERSYVKPEEVSEALSMELPDVKRSMARLARTGYIVGAGSAESDAPIFVTSVTERAFRAVGAWPTAEVLADRLAAAFDEAANSTEDKEKKGRLRTMADGIGGAGRSIAVSVLTQYVERQMGLSS